MVTVFNPALETGVAPLRPVSRRARASLVCGQWPLPATLRTHPFPAGIDGLRQRSQAAIDAMRFAPASGTAPASLDDRCAAESLPVVEDDRARSAAGAPCPPGESAVEGGEKPWITSLRDGCFLVPGPIINGPRLLNVFDVGLGPIADPRHQFTERATEFRQRVLNLRWNAGIDSSRYDAVTFKPAKRVRQHLLRNPIDGSAKLREPQGSGRQPPNDQHAPFIGNPI